MKILIEKFFDSVSISVLSTVVSLKVLPNGDLASAFGRTIKIWDSGTGFLKKTLVEDSRSLYSMTFFR